MVNTRILERTIPSEFIRFDTHVTDDDAFVNVRDLQRARLNLNILIARRMRGTIFALQMRSAGVLGQPLMTIATARPADKTHGDVIFSAPILVSPFTKDCKFNINMFRVGGVDAEVYPVITGPGEPVELSDLVKIIADGVTLTQESVLVPVPQSVRESGIGTFTLYFTTDAGLVNVVGGPFAIADVGLNYLETTSATPVVDQILFIDTDADIDKRLISRIVTVGANRRLYMDTPWNKIPDPAVDTFQLRPVTTLSIGSVALVEEPSTTFEISQVLQ